MEQSIGRCEMCADQSDRLYTIKYSVANPGINIAHMKQAHVCGECAYQITEEEKENTRRIGRII